MSEPEGLSEGFRSCGVLSFACIERDIWLLLRVTFNRGARSHVYDICIGILVVGRGIRVTIRVDEVFVLWAYVILYDCVPRRYGIAWSTSRIDVAIGAMRRCAILGVGNYMSKLVM